VTRDALRNLPVLDLDPLVGGDRSRTERLAAEVDACLEEFGFLVVVGQRQGRGSRRLGEGQADQALIVTAACGSGANAPDPQVLGAVVVVSSRWGKGEARKRLA
jgi:hypothetical protein